LHALPKDYLGDQIKAHEVGGTCNTQENVKKAYNNSVKKPEGKKLNGETLS